MTFFSIPKTGTTAYELLLKRHADIIFSGKPSVKHMSVRQYEKSLAPYLRRVLRSDPERVAVIREPISWLGSWYRYRQRPNTKDHAKSTRGVSFNEFIEAYLGEGTRPAFANLGSQSQFLSSRQGRLRVDHVFAQENGDLLSSFLSERLGVSCEAKRLNVSPKAELEMDDSLRQVLENRLEKDYTLYQRVKQAGGHLSGLREKNPKT